MKRIKSRTKNSSMSDANLGKDTFANKINSYQTGLSSRWQGLSPRDQLALLILSLFLLLLVGGYGGYSVHQAAKDSKQEYQEQIADYFWLRAQAGNIDNNALMASSEEGAAIPPASKVSSLLSNSGIIDAQVVAAGESVQMSFTHASQATVSAALNQLTQQGWQFTQLAMEQDEMTKAITVQAIITS